MSRCEKTAVASPRRRRPSFARPPLAPVPSPVLTLPAPMATGSTLYRIEVSLSDLDAGAYSSLTIRVAQHSSEDAARVVARVLAYCFAYEEGLSFGRGLDEPDEPALVLHDATGNLDHWIDVGHPSADRLHRASKAARRVTVLCHKSPDGLLRERAKRPIHRADALAVWLVAPELVQSVAEKLERSSEWSIVRTGEELLISIGEASFSGAFVQTTLAALDA